MDPAEEIVSIWLQQQGFFIMGEVEVGFQGKEIDFLGVNLATGGRVHVEVHASVAPLGPLRAWSPAKYGSMFMEDRIKHYISDKFIGSTVEGTGELRNRKVEEAAKLRLGQQYEKWMVLGTLHKKENEAEVRAEFQKNGVKVVFLREVLAQIRFRGVARSATGRFIQLLAEMVTVMDEEEEREYLMSKFGSRVVFHYPDYHRRALQRGGLGEE